jgi:hypothetical protein
LPEFTPTGSRGESADVRHYDLLLLGGGFYGAVIAAYARKLQPTWRVGVIERGTALLQGEGADVLLQTRAVALSRSGRHGLRVECEADAGTFACQAC